MAATLTTLDVSKWQDPNSFDWEGYKKRGANSIIIQLSHGTSYEPKAKEFIAKAKENGLVVHGYHFYEGDYEKEIPFSIKNAKNLGLPDGAYMFLDMEGSISGDWQKQFYAFRGNWLQCGWHVGLYVSEYPYKSRFDNEKLVQDNVYRWIANYSHEPANYDIWQYSSSNGVQDVSYDRAGKLGVPYQPHQIPAIVPPDKKGDKDSNFEPAPRIPIKPTGNSWVGWGNDSSGLGGGKTIGYSTDGKNFYAALWPGGFVFRQTDADQMWELLKSKIKPSTISSKIEWSSILNKPDVALKSDIPTIPDLSGYALKSELPKPVDLTGYAKVTDIPKTPDLSGYAKLTDIPSVTGLVKEADLSDYAKKSDIPKLPDLSEYLQKKPTPMAEGDLNNLDAGIYLLTGKASAYKNLPPDLDAEGSNRPKLTVVLGNRGHGGYVQILFDAMNYSYRRSFVPSRNVLSQWSKSIKMWDLQNVYLPQATNDANRHTDQQISAVKDSLKNYAKLVDIPSVKDFLKKSDLSGYATKQDLPDLTGFAKKTDLPVPVDLTGYALKSDIPSLTDYVKQEELANYAKKGDLPSSVDLSGYAKLTDIPSVTDLVKKAELADYVKKTDIPALPDLSKYALKKDIPTSMNWDDVTDKPNLALKSEIPSLDGYAKLTDIPSVSGLVKEAELDDYAKKGEISKLRSDIDTNFAKKGDIQKVDLSGYAKLTDIPSVSGLVKETELNDYAKKTDIPTLPDLSGYAKVSDLIDYAKKADLPDFNKFALKSEIPTSMAWDSITDKPDLAVKSDIPTTMGWDEITNKPDLFTANDLPKDLVHTSDLTAISDTANSAKEKADSNSLALANKADKSDIPDVSRFMTTDQFQENESQLEQALSDDIESSVNSIQEATENNATSISNLKELVNNLNQVKTITSGTLADLADKNGQYHYEIECTPSDLPSGVYDYGMCDVTVGSHYAKEVFTVTGANDNNGRVFVRVRKYDSSSWEDWREVTLWS